MSDFKSQKEIYQWLIDDEKVIGNISGNMVWLDKTGTLVNSSPHPILHTFEDPSNWAKVIKPLPWYTNIPKQGILCWCWGTSSAIKTIALVKVYNREDHTFSVTLASRPFLNAEPLTHEECLSYIYLKSTQITVD